MSFKLHAQIGIFHAVLQMFRGGQNCEFCHIESRGKNDATALVKLQWTSFFLHIWSLFL